MGKYEEAEMLHQEAFDLQVKLFGREHPDVAGSLNNLASVYAGDYENIMSLCLRECIVS
jgi:hypothetical protein